MADLEKLKTGVVSNLRACLISAPGGILSTRLNNDYKALLGENIPYKKLGFNTLESFLESLPDISVKRKNGDYFIEAAKSADSAHITNLVERQKRASKKNSRRRPMPVRRSAYTRPPQEQYFKYSPPKFRPKQNISNFTTLQPQTNPGYKPRQGSSQHRPNLSAPDYSYIKPLIPDYKRPTSSNAESKPVVNNSPKTPPKPFVNNSSLPKTQPVEIKTVTKPLKKEPDQEKTFTDKNMSSNSPLPISSSSPIPKKENNSPPPTPAIQFSNLSRRGAHRDIKPIATNTSPPKRTQFIVTDTPYKHDMAYCRVILPEHYEKNSMVKKLCELVHQNLWPTPEFYVLKLKVNKGPDSVMCRASIICTSNDCNSRKTCVPDSYEYTSYPHNFTDPNEAIEYVASKAFNDLIKQSSIILPETKDTALIILRIADIIKGRDCGVWGFQVVNDYEQTYGETIPAYLPELLKQSDILKVEKLTDAQYIIYDKSRPEKPIQALQNCPPLILPDVDIWDVFVTSVLSINRITVRLIGPQYSGEYEKLLNKMEAYYLKIHTLPVNILQIGRYYMHIDSDADTCSRVLLLEMLSDIDDKPLVMFIDHGDKDRVPRSTLRAIKNEYLDLPAQSFEVNLRGLEHYTFKSPPYKYCAIDDVVGRSYVAVVHSRDPYYLTLNDTSGEIDIDVNEMIQREIRYSFTSPHLTEVGKITEVIVVGKTDKGELMINIPSDTLLCLQETLDLIDEGQVEVKNVTCPKDIDITNVYILRGETKLRAMLRQAVSATKVEVDIIDLGYAQQVEMKDLIYVPSINDILYTIPPQALKVALSNVDSNTIKSKWAQYDELLPVISKAIVKLIVPSQVPLVECFKRSEPGNALISVNDTLMFDSGNVLTIKESDLDLSKLALDDDMHFEQEKFGLPKPILPKLEEKFFNIYVLDFANPHNFTVQPVMYLDSLNKLMIQMKNHYNKLRMNNQETIWHVGELCVVPSVHTGDTFFYRAYIEQIIDENTVSVRYCDYGNMGVFNTYLLRPILPEFKSLPFIGFNAKLHGIKPKNGDWDAHVCAEMKTSMNNKKFFAIIKSVNVGFDNSFSTLSLEIIDTSTKEDIDIAAKLVFSGAALFY